MLRPFSCNLYLNSLYVVYGCTRKQGTTYIVMSLFYSNLMVCKYLLHTFLHTHLHDNEC